MAFWVGPRAHTELPGLLHLIGMTYVTPFWGPLGGPRSFTGGSWVLLGHDPKGGLQKGVQNELVPRSSGHPGLDHLSVASFSHRHDISTQGKSTPLIISLVGSHRPEVDVILLIWGVRSDTGCYVATSPDLGSEGSDLRSRSGV